MAISDRIQPEPAPQSPRLPMLSSLIDIAQQTISMRGNQPLLLDDADLVWIVLAGHLDLFAVRRGANQTIRARRHLFRVEAGQCVWGIEPPLLPTSVALQARGAPGAHVIAVSWHCLQELASTPSSQLAVIRLLEEWLAALSRAVTPVRLAQPDVFLEPDSEIVLESGQTAAPQQQLLWVRSLQGTVALLDHPDPLSAAVPMFIALAPSARLVAVESATLRIMTTEQWLLQDQMWTGVRQFHADALTRIAALMEEAQRAERLRLARKTALQQTMMDRTLSRLAGLLQSETREPAPVVDEASTDPLLAACQVVGASVGVSIRPPLDPLPGGSHGERVRQIAEASAIRTRPVVLRGDWWQRDHGALLAVLKDQDGPVALLPASDHSYDLFDPGTNSTIPVTAAVADRLSPFATMFYRPFPHDVVTTWELLRFALRGCRADVQQVLVSAGLASVLSLVTPLAIAYLIDTVIPRGTPGELLEIGMLLLVTAIAITGFEVAQGLALLRIEGRVGNGVQSAMWDRLLNLPARFFRSYTVGDLGDRAMGIQAIRNVISGPVVGAILAGIFSLVNLLLLVYLDRWLALGALGLVAVAAVITTATALIQRRYQYQLVELEGRISGMVLQFVNGISKFHVAGAEGRAFTVWAQEFFYQRQVHYRIRTIDNRFQVFNAVYMVLTTLALFGMVTLAGRENLSPGVFLAFTSAFSQLLLGTVELGSALIALLSIGPIYARAKPILHERPELSAAKVSPGRLTGNIELSHVSFRYKPQGPLIVEDISLQIKPGEFIALVGSSGSGKSTLLRLLLGFEVPQSGTISYDHSDLARLDVRAVRQQVGVVLQHGKLLTGSILENILGSSSLTLEHAWEAARMAGIDEDIRRMPMGMQTLLTDGGGTLSGGQRQRLLIARALVKRPRIVFFDEATSALDNRSQQVVGESLAQLKATRIVIAHRLSTVMYADRIVVLEQSKIVQTGTYQELIKAPGHFADLARRQLL